MQIYYSSGADREPSETRDDPVLIFYAKAYRKDGQKYHGDEEFATGGAVQAILGGGVEGNFARMESMFEVPGDGSTLESGVAR